MTATSPPDKTRRENALPRLDPLRPKGAVRASRRSRWRAASLVAVHLLILGHVVHWLVAGTTLTPVEPSEAMQTLELGYVNAGFLLFVALILATLVLGRFFCGWACHVVAYQDFCAWLLKKLGFRPRPVRSRLLVLVPFLVAGYMFFWPTLKRWFESRPAPELQMHLTTQGFWDTFPGVVMTVVTVLVAGGLMIWWLGAKGFCTYGCPYGAFFITVDHLAPGRIRVTDDCESCGHCTSVCSSNVRVHEEVARHGMVVDPGCMKCMDCVSVCPKGALYYGFGKPPALRRGLFGRVRAWFGRWYRGAGSRRSDFSWGEELLMAGVFLVAWLAFRSLYALVPLLLSGGLAVLSAIAAVMLLRLCRREDLDVQHWTLKRDGRTTRAGWAWGAALALFVAFTAHSAFFKWHAWRGEVALQAFYDPGTRGADRQDLVLASLEHSSAAAGMGFFDDPFVLLRLGLAETELGRFADAEESLRRSLAARSDLHQAAVRLGDLLLAKARSTGAASPRDEAVSLYRRVVEQDPGHPVATQRLRALGLEPGRR